VKSIRSAIVLLILFSIAAFSQGHPEMGKLTWLSGCWKAEGNLQTEEQWTRLDGQSMLGMGRTIANGKTVSYEFLQIRVRGEEIFYIAQPNGGSAVEFKLVKINDNGAIFENPQHDFPQRIAYSRSPDGGLVAAIEGQEKGKPKRVDFAMRKVRCD
jgi:hypothetical protein